MVIFFPLLSLIHNSHSFLFLSNLQKEVEKLKAETEELKKSKSHLDGQAFELRRDLKETREENTKLKIELERQSDSIHKLEKVGFSLHTL